MTAPHLDALVLDVASSLACKCAEIDELRWRQCEAGRFRSTVSRAYYSVFLALKRRICEGAAPTYEFPIYSVHGLLLDALSNTFGSGHGLTRRVKTLKHSRMRADYEFGAGPNRGFADARLREAADARALVASLTPADLGRLRGELSALAAIAAKRRS